MITKAVDIEQKEKGLIIRVKSGESGAYKELVCGYTPRLYAYLYRMLGNHQDAEDVLQDALLSGYEHIHQFNGKSMFSTWLYRIAINISCKVLRQKQLFHFQDKFKYGGPDDDNKAGAQAEIADTRQDIAKKISQNEVKEKVRFAIARLPRKLAEVIVLKELEDCSYGEISERLAIPSGTVMSRLFRARLKLAKRLKREGLGITKDNGARR